METLREQTERRRENKEMTLCSCEVQKWTIISLASITITLTIGLVSLVGQTNGYGKSHIQSYVNGEFEIALNYCIEHAGDKLNPLQELLGQKVDPIQDLVDKGLVAEWFSNYDNCAQVKTDYDNMRLIPMEKWNEALQDSGQSTNITKLIEAGNSGKDLMCGENYEGNKMYCDAIQGGKNETK
jgi:hypothetical protein